MGMRGQALTLLGLICLGCASGEAQIPDPEGQIASALAAAPADRRDAATVVGFDAQGKSVTLREGTNDLVCLSDYPLDDDWNTACYHESLEPYMARGRELREAGEGEGSLQRRWEEIEAGTLPYPDTPTTLYVLHGDGWDATAAQAINPYLRWVIYMPYATAESTGLQTEPTQNGPWLMYPGEVGAHVMITPPRG